MLSREKKSGHFLFTKRLEGSVHLPVRLKLADELVLSHLSLALEIFLCTQQLCAEVQQYLADIMHVYWFNTTPCSGIERIQSVYKYLSTQFQGFSCLHGQHAGLP